MKKNYQEYSKYVMDKRKEDQAFHVVRMKEQYETLMEENDILRVELDNKQNAINTLEIKLQVLRTQLREAQTIVIK